MEKTTNLKYHIAATLVVMVWGATFVSTKVLLGNGLEPVEIFLYRFLMAYAGIWFFSPRKLFADNLKDELLMVSVGITGGSLYFWAENTALEYTLASNVSLIIAATPLITALLTRLFFRSQKLKSNLIWGSLVALAGVALVVFNGNYILRLNPLGDMLTLLAALCWGFYSIAMQKLGDRYSPTFITRKIFFYGLVTLIPFIIIEKTEFHLSALGTPVVWLNLIFLGIVASLVCYLVWNVALLKLGTVKASNYLYFIPLVTMITSAIAINERITAVAAAGAALILAGVWLAEKGVKKSPKRRAGNISQR